MLIPDGFRVVPGAPESPTILHVPHSSRAIPADVRAGLRLTDDELARELDRMTDARTDEIAERAAATARHRPWLFVNELSRLVVDPERFPDDREPMRAVGMGAVYTRTSDGQPLRTGADDALLDRWFHPYARAITGLVDDRLAATGQAVIIDVHSYPRQRLRYELGAAHRPAVCLGTDPTHTPDRLLAAARSAFAGYGDVAENAPFAGCYVPLKHYQRDHRVTGIMVELRRDTYLIEPLTEGLAAMSRAVAALIDDAAHGSPPMG